jgi:hypothetical protein
LSRADVGALEHLRQNAPLDAVVANLVPASGPEADTRPPSVPSMPLVAAFAGRRAVLEYYRPDVDPSISRLRALRRLFTTTEAAEGEALLDRFTVDYVLEHRARPLRFASPRLSVDYEADEVRLWRVARPGGAGRPGPLAGPPGLR